MMFTVKQVAERLNVSPSCIYQLVESGHLPHHRIGLGRGAIRFSETDLNDYLAHARHSASTERSPPRPSRSKLKHLKL